MDKKKSLLLLTTLPVFVGATSNYDDSIKLSNGYIGNFSDYEKYLLIRQNEKEFIRGGFLSKEEFDISNVKGSSYLAPGIQYWTSTDTDNGKKYVIDYSLKELDKVQKSGVRVTEYVKPHVSVSGTGSISAPWNFIDEFKVTAKSSNKKYGDVNADDSIQTILKGESAVIRFNEKKGYKFDSFSCQNGLAVVSNNSLILSNINSDVSCVLNFVPKVDTPYIVNYYEENPNDSAYTLAKIDNLKGETESTINLINKEIEDKYSGFSINQTKSKLSGVIDANNILNLDVYLDRKKYTATVTPNGNGFNSVTGSGTYKFGQKVYLVANVSSNYTFSSWSGDHAGTSPSTSFDMPNKNVVIKATAMVTYVPSYTPDPPYTPGPTPSNPGTGSSGPDCNATCQMQSKSEEWYNNGVDRNQLHNDNMNLAGYYENGSKIPNVPANPDCVGGCWFEPSSGVWYTGSNGDTNKPLYEDSHTNTSGTNTSPTTCTGNGC